MSSFNGRRDKQQTCVEGFGELPQKVYSLRLASFFLVHHLSTLYIAIYHEQVFDGKNLSKYSTLFWAAALLAFHILPSGEMFDKSWQREEK